jgi:intracellular sulfur oxidation DsrE/DsrF family protein
LLRAAPEQALALADAIREANRNEFESNPLRRPVWFFSFSAVIRTRRSVLRPLLRGFTTCRSSLCDLRAADGVVFDIGKAAPKIDDVNPGLATVARYLNTLAKNGVPADRRKIAVVFHQGGTEIVQNNEAFKARNHGHDNPNITLIQSLKKAGVDFRVCGQAVLGSKIDPKTIQPEIELDLWALTTIANLELRGYVHVGN